MLNRAEPLLIVATMLASLGWLASKQIVAELPAIAFIGWRFLGAGVILLLLPSVRRQLARTKAMNIGIGLLLGLLLGSGLLVWVQAVMRTSALGQGAFIVSLSLLLVPLLAWLLFRQRPHRRFWLSAPIAFSGLLALAANNDFQLSSDQLWFLAAAGLLSLHFTCNQRATVSLAPLAATALQLIATGILGLGIAAYHSEFSLLAQPVSSSIWLWLVVSILLATVLRFSCQIKAQGLLTPSVAAAIMLLEPIWTLLLSVAILDESMSFMQISGCTLILSSLLVYVLPQRSSIDISCAK